MKLRIYQKILICIAIALLLPLHIYGEMLNRIDASCRTCSDYGMRFICELNDFRRVATVFAESLGGVRSSFQVDQYVECQMRARGEKEIPQWLDDYKNNYRHYIKTSAETFGVPPQLLQCAFLKEGVYNASVADSHSGAKGLCQFMPATRQHVHDILKNAAARRESGKIFEFRELVESGKAKESDRDYLTTVFKQDDYLQMWNQNFVSLDEQGRYPFPDKDGQFDPPTSFSGIGVKRPQNCIAAAALYFRHIASTLSLDIKPISQEQLLSGERDAGAANSALNLMLVMGASYNAGPGTISELLKDLKKPATLQKMVDTLESSQNTEMKEYIKSLRNCLQPGNFAPPERWYDVDGRAPPSCEEYRESEADLGLIPIEYWP